MTIPVTSSRVSYIASASQTTFAYPFVIYTDTDIRVYMDGVLKTLGTHYTVTSVGSPGGGNVILTTGATAGASVVIVCMLPISQLTSYPPNNPFPAAAHETALDRAIKIDQQLQEQLNRTPKLPQSSTITGVSLPPPDSLAVASNGRKLLAWNVPETNLELVEMVSTATAIAPTGEYNVADFASPQEAIDHAPAGSVVYFPPGKHQPSSALTINKALTIRGSGQGEPQDIVDGIVTGTWIEPTEAGQVAFAVNMRSQVRFEHLTINAGNSGQTGITITGPDISLKGCVHWMIDACTFYGLDIGVEQTAGLFSVVSRCLFWNCTVASLVLDNIYHNDQGDHAVYGCTFLGLGIGVLVRNGGLRFYGNKTFGFTTAIAIDASALDHDAAVLIITGNSIEHFTGNAILAVRPSGANTFKLIVITGNEIASLEPGVNGIQVSSDGLTFTNQYTIGQNYILVDTAGIAINGGNHYLIEGNYIEDAATGISFTEAGTIATVGINHFVNVATPLNNAVAAGITWTMTAPVTFAQLPLAANGSLLYVSDGLRTLPVAAGGLGCFARRLNGVWDGRAGALSAGTATIPSGATSIAVTHVAGTTPTLAQIMLTLLNNPTVDPGNFWVDTVGATQFTIRCRTDPSTSGAAFGWAVIP